MAITNPGDMEARVEHLQGTVDQLSAKVDSYHISLVNIVDKKRKKKSDDVSVFSQKIISLSLSLALSLSLSFVF